MLKKCTILGLAFLVAGGLAYAWLRQQAQAERPQGVTPATGYSLESDEYLEKYGRWYTLTPEQQNQLALQMDKDRQSKSPEDVKAEQQARLRANLPRLATGELNPGDIADFLYGSGWEEQVVLYQQRREQEQIAQTVAIVCLSIGSLLVVGCLLLWVLLSIGRAVKAVGERQAARRRTVDFDPTELTDILHDPKEDDGLEDEEVLEEESPRLATQAPRPTVNSDDDGGSERFIVPRAHRDVAAGRPFLATPPRLDESPVAECLVDESPVAVLLSDKPDTDEEWSPEMEWSSAPVSAAPEKQRFTPRPKVMVLGEYQPDSSAETATAEEETTAADANPLKSQADDLQRQIAEFKEMAQSVQQASQEQASPLGSTLKELAQQVSAIREYAASQQNRVEKLQDGYDWSIIRTFCLRVIRCIDNLENRIIRLDDDDDAAAHLDEVKDELLFALESSGIEQFRPEIHSDYRGQEKLAEAVKDKEPAGDEAEIGKIAKVIRPGYRYILDEESCKIVRTAQVKLFG